ncbi:hypothetical protein NLJ89_g588 [Agrocybe chaxingu]|uniref:Fungal N-terminal domain-containing protein n=1 Tax=Agrocybe chaxingu TaxID=84603 RepID=A0A9W8TGC0_9AGAR|nr:hypothetical protein NLJ89_g588 [Agrocybe chaxingu]
MALAPTIRDLVTLGTAVASIVRAVNETCSTCAECYDLAMELSSFCDMIFVLQAMLETVIVSPANQATLDLIHDEILQCRALLDSFVDRILPAMNRTGSTNMMRRSLRVLSRKVWWGLFHKKEVAKVQMKVNGQRLQFLMLLHRPSAEYKDLVDELNSFCNMLAVLRCTLQNAPISPDNEFVLNSIHMEMARCRALVDAFIDTIKPYHRALNATGGTSRRRHSLRVIFRKVWWALFRKEDVSKVQARMMSHRMQIVVLLNSLSVPGAVTGVPSKVGYRRVNGLEFVDLMGKTVIFPWELCYSWELGMRSKDKIDDARGEASVA